MPWNFVWSLNLPMDIIIGTIPITLPAASRNNSENASENIDNQQQQPILVLEDRESIKSLKIFKNIFLYTYINIAPPRYEDCYFPEETQNGTTELNIIRQAY